MTVSSVACTVYGNGTYWGNCANNVTLQHFFATPVWYTQLLYILLVPIGLLVVDEVQHRYFQYGYGRFLQHYQGIVGIGRYGAGPGVLGKITRFHDRIGLFDTGKKGIKKLIAIMPNSIVQIEQSKGGVSFTQVDLDKGTTVTPEAAAWANQKLGELAETHNWQDFVFKWKLKEIESFVKAGAQFPPLSELEPDKKVTVPTINQGYVHLEKPQLKAVSTLSEEERTWWGVMTAKEEAIAVANRELEVKLHAFMSKAKTYAWAGQVVPITGSAKQDLAERLTIELKDAKGDIANAVFGGETIPAQGVAALMAGMPWASYVNSLYGDLLEKAKQALKGQWAQYIPVAFAFAIIICAAAFGVYLIGHG